MIPEGAVAKARELSEAHMPDLLEVVAMEDGGRDEYGDPLPTAPVVVATSKCRRRPLSGGEQVVAGSLQSSVQAAIDFPVDVELTSAMTVRVGGVSYNVKHVEVRSEKLSAHRTALVAQ